MVNLFFLVSNQDMKIERPLSSLEATNGLMSSYAPRPHKRKRRGLRLAILILLGAMASFVFIEKANTSDICRHPILAVEMLNPNYFEKYKCSDNTLKLIVSELKPLSSCLFPSQPKADFDWGSEMLEVKIAQFCVKNPNGKYSDFNDELWLALGF